jgi:predicted transcriptional regulator
MPGPEGKLTVVQHQIMQVLWQHGENGATASEIWQEICADRQVGRTTVLKQIQRLEQRHWLRRKADAGVARYVAALDQQQTAKMLAGEFVDDFFDGSLCDLVMSVLGSREIQAGDVQRLQQLLDDHAARRDSRRKRS